MAKICNKDGCSYPVFGGGFCKVHQYLRKNYKQPSPVRKPIKRVSDKRAKENALYKVMRKEFLKAKPKCEVCIALKEPFINDSTEVHHKWSGKDRAKYFLDSSSWLAICRKHHNRIHSEPQWSREHGYLK